MHCQHLSPHRPEFTSTRLTMVSLAALRPVCYMYMYYSVHCSEWQLTARAPNNWKGRKETGIVIREKERRDGNLVWKVQRWSSDYMRWETVPQTSGHNSKRSVADSRQQSVPDGWGLWRGGTPSVSAGRRSSEQTGLILEVCTGTETKPHPRPSSPLPCRPLVDIDAPKQRLCGKSSQEPWASESSGLRCGQSLVTIKRRWWRHLKIFGCLSWCTF